MKALIILVMLFTISGCATSYDAQIDNKLIEEEKYNITSGSQTYRDFNIDNILHSEDYGDIHFNIYIPSSYDGNKSYALFITLPGYEGLYFQGVAVNLKNENFGYEAQKYNAEMIIVAPQLNGWDNLSANQTIELVEYLLDTYNIDKNKVYIEGYSGGGETASIAVSLRPDLFTAYLQVSSKWDGEYQTVVDRRLPVYIVIGKDDEYYGTSPSIDVYNALYSFYLKSGLSKEEIDEILVLDIKEDDYFTSRNAPNQHGGGGLFAFDEDIMSWFFGK